MVSSTRKDSFKNSNLSSPHVLMSLAQAVCDDTELSLKLEKGGRGMKGDAVLHLDPNTGQWVQSFGVLQTKDSAMYRTLALMIGKDWDVSLNSTIEPFIAIRLIEKHGDAVYR